MTQEQKELLLKDLCARIPHGVKILIPSWDEREMEYVDRVDTLYSVNGDNYVIVTNEYYDFCVEDIKPYLFPLSSMNKEQLLELASISFENSIDSSIKTLDWCYRNHYDVNNLIPMGLANDATGLNIY